MKKLAFLVVPLVLLLTSVSALAQGDATVATRTTAALGTFLTEPNGQTLYTFSGDTSGVSNVSGQLAVVWPPFRASGALTLPAGVGGTLSQITRADGTMQVAYNGMPLYTFTGDPAPNVVNGQGGAGNRFFVATAQVTAATSTPVTVASATAAATSTPISGATVTPAASATVSPTALPRTGEPSVPLGPVALLGIVALGLGGLLWLRTASPR